MNPFAIRLGMFVSPQHPEQHTYSNCFAHVRILFLAIPSVLFSVLPASAIIDFNYNGVSDLWEIHYNEGELYTNFTPAADPDGDGWTNAQEAAAGTNPFDATQPDGILVPTIHVTPVTYHDPDADGIPDILTPETATITWSTLAGKLYSLQFSLDLQTGSWAILGDPVIGDGTICGQAIVITQPDGSRPENLFWRVTISDLDSDGDDISDAEESDLGTNPNSNSPTNDVVAADYTVTYGGFDPAGYDTSEYFDGGEPNGIAEIGAGPVPASTYAPIFVYTAYTSSLDYEAIEYFVDGETTIIGDLWKSNSWESSSNSHSTLSAKIPLESLSGMLPAFDADESLDPWYSYHRFSFRNSCNIQTSGETVGLKQAQVKLVASAPVAVPITKHLMVVNRTYADDQTSIEIARRSFTIQATQSASDPQVLGDDFVLGGETTVDTDAYLVRLYPGYLTDSEGWDTTGPELWQSLGVGETVPSRVDANWNDFTGQITQLLELVVGEGAGSPAITLSEINWHANGCNFKINGVSPTAIGGAEIVLRLKSNHSVVFDTMRVHVFEKRTIPVSIIHVWDSRKSKSRVKNAIGNGAIMNSLNGTYNKQANVFYKFKYVKTVDLKRDPTKWPFQGDEPLLFLADGSFDNSEFSTAMSDAWALTQKQTPAPAKLTIHVVNEFLDPFVGGGTFKPEPLRNDKTIFITAAATPVIIAHEAGHALDLSTRAVGNQSLHDHGEWPSWWDEGDPAKSRVGLMFDLALPSMQPWIRREDWWKANEIAPELE